jgi:hypothetical protein
MQRPPRPGRLLPDPPAGRASATHAGRRQPGRGSWEADLNQAGGTALASHRLVAQIGTDFRAQIRTPARASNTARRVPRRITQRRNNTTARRITAPPAARPRHRTPVAVAEGRTVAVAAVDTDTADDFPSAAPAASVNATGAAFFALFLRDSTVDTTGSRRDAAQQFRMVQRNWRRLCRFHLVCGVALAI